MKYYVSGINEFYEVLEESRKLPQDEGRQIIFREGFYSQGSSIILDNRDNDLSICGEGKVVLSGGVHIDDWKAEDGYFTAIIPGRAEPRILFSEDKVLSRSRYPSQGYLENIDEPVDLKWMTSSKGGWNRPPSQYELTHMTAAQGDIPLNMDLKNAEIAMYHIWDESTLLVKEYDPNTGIISFMSEAEHPAGAFKRHKYVIWNIREGLCESGQWYFNKTQMKIYYKPFPGQIAESFEAWTPVADNIIKIINGRNIKIYNITMNLSDTPAVSSGLRAILPNGAVDVRNSDGIILKGINISNVSGNVIKFTGCRNVSVNDCNVIRTGASGIVTYECENEIITGNVVRSTGKLYTSAVGIHCGGKSTLLYVLGGCKPESGSVSLTHNVIDDVPYCGITCSGGPHIIEHNRLSNCMTVLHDGSAIYCSRAIGTKVRFNYVTDIDSEVGYAYYFDEQSHDSILEGNVSINVPLPLLCHRSNNIAMNNNIFICRDKCEIKMANTKAIYWQNNIISAGGDIKFVYIMKWQNSEPGYTADLFNEVIKFRSCTLYSESSNIYINKEKFPDIEGVSRNNPGIDAGLLENPEAYINSSLSK